jgi:hypothetical protein
MGSTGAVVTLRVYEELYAATVANADGAPIATPS